MNCNIINGIKFNIGNVLLRSGFTFSYKPFERKPLCSVGISVEI